MRLTYESFHRLGVPSFLVDLVDIVGTLVRTHLLHSLQDSWLSGCNEHCCNVMGTLNLKYNESKFKNFRICKCLGHILKIEKETAKHQHVSGWIW